MVLEAYTLRKFNHFTFKIIDCLVQLSYIFFLTFKKKGEMRQ